jgi:hypothetical protein
MFGAASSAAAASAAPAIHRWRGGAVGATTTMSDATATSASTFTTNSPSGLPAAAQIAAIGGG